MIWNNSESSFTILDDRNNGESSLTMADYLEQRRIFINNGRRSGTITDFSIKNNSGISFYDGKQSESGTASYSNNKMMDNEEQGGTLSKDGRRTIMHLFYSLFITTFSYLKYIFYVHNEYFC